MIFLLSRYFLTITCVITVICNLHLLLLHGRDFAFHFLRSIQSIVRVTALERKTFSFSTIFSGNKLQISNEIPIRKTGVDYK